MVLAGYLTKATVDGVYSEAIIKARDGHAGGVVGTISDSISDGYGVGAGYQTCTGICDAVIGVLYSDGEVEKAVKGR